MGALKTTSLATGKREIEYPESDGKPMAETDLHRDEMVDLIAMLKARYLRADDVYVSGNLLLYYEEGNPRAAVAPDVFVVFGVPSGRRRTYKMWVERVPPAVVIEVTSRKTRREDLHEKMGKYAHLGVAEYFLYDPEADYLRPALQGFQLSSGAWRPMAPTESGGLRSHQLGLELRLEAGRLELYDAATSIRLLRTAEKDAAGARAEERAEAERRRADAEHTQAAAERQRADAAEAELARLRATLARLQDGDDATTAADHG